MRKILLTGFLGIITMLSGFLPGRAATVASSTTPVGIRVVESSQSGVVLELLAPQTEIRKSINPDGSLTLHYPGANMSQEPGLPQLPQFSALLGVPANAEIKLSLLDNEQSILPGKIRIKTSPYPAVLEEDLQPGGWTDQPPFSPAQKAPVNSIIPAVPVKISDPAWMRDQRLVRVEFYPAQYLAAENQLLWHSRLTVRVDFHVNQGQDNPSLLQQQEQADSFDSYLEQVLLNFSTARAWQGFPIESNQALHLDEQKPPMTSNAQSGQTRYRIAISKDGLYRLTYQELVNAGVPVDGLALSDLKLSTQGQTAAYYFQDAQQDGLFNQGDGLVFYGQKFYGDRMAQRYSGENAHWYTYSRQLPDGSSVDWKPEMNATMLEKYTDVNVYWLTVDGSTPGMNETDHNQGNPEKFLSLPSQWTDSAQAVYLPLAIKAGLAQFYFQISRAEESTRWRTTLFAGEETWFWEEIKTSTDAIRTYPIQLSSVAGSGTAILRGEIVAAAYNSSASPDHHIQVFLNDPGQTQPVIDATWDGRSRFYFEGQLSQARLVEGENQLMLKVILLPTMIVEDLFVDWFEIEYQRRFVAQDDQLTFQASGDGTWQYTIDGFSSSGVLVFDISNPLQPLRIQNILMQGGGSIRFRVTQATGDRFIAAKPQDIPASGIHPYSPPDFSQPADYVIIAPPEFVSTAQALADFRTGLGFSTQVFNLNDLYNEFNDGILNPVAIKNFLKFTLSSWGAPPQYAVLVGDGHWNLKGFSGYDSPPVYMPPNLVWVDPWQGEVDSANLLATVVGDDPLPDVMIGRIPVNSAAQLQTVIDKIIAYENAPLADWQYHLLFIADDTPDDAGDFVAQSNQIISEYVSGNYAADKVYLDDFKDTNTCNLQPGDPTYMCPAATAAIVNDLNQIGALIVNYDGHGAINYWTGEQIFRNGDIASLANGSRLPVVLSMTCLDGYWIHPNLESADKSGPSLIEEMLRASQKGAVAAFSPTGLGVSTGHNALQRGFYDALFKNGIKELGAAAQSAKLNLYSTGHNDDLLHTFTIFGDPALRLPIP